MGLKYNMIGLTLSALALVGCSRESSFDLIIKRFLENHLSHHITEGDVYGFEIYLPENFFGKPLYAFVTLNDRHPLNARNLSREDTLYIGLYEPNVAVRGVKIPVHMFKDNGLDGLDDYSGIANLNEEAAYNDIVSRINSALSK